MTQNIVGIDENTEPIVVPSVGDPVTDNSLKQPWQGLANKAKFLGNLIAANVSDIATNVSSIASNVSSIASNASGISSNASSISGNATNIGSSVLGPHEGRIVTLEDSGIPIGDAKSYYTGVFTALNVLTIIRNLVVPQGASAFIEFEITAHGDALGDNGAWSLWRRSSWLVTTWDNSNTPNVSTTNVQTMSGTDGTGVFEHELKGQVSIDDVVLDLVPLSDNSNSLDLKIDPNSRSADGRYYISMMLSE